MEKKLLAIACAPMAILAVTGCGNDTGDEDIQNQDRLMALLRDEPLTQVPPAQSEATRGDDSVGVASQTESNVILPGTNPTGAWEFNDCNASRTNLSDSTFSDNTAFRSVGVTCTQGIDNSQAVSLAVREDIVYVPDQPNFTFESGITVAGWFRPTATGGTRTLFRKRDKDTSSFALLLNAGRFEFVVSLGDGRAITVISPRRATAGVFQHVGATYDGATARLYVDGVEVTNVPFAGAIPPGPGPLLMGNDGSERRFAGAIDSTLFATHAITAEQMLALTCLRSVQPTVRVTPVGQGSTPAGVPMTFDFALTNNNTTAACGSLRFNVLVHEETGRVALSPAPNLTVQSQPVPFNTTEHFLLTATPNDDVEPGTFLSFHTHVDEPNTFFSTIFSHSIIVAEPDPSICTVRTNRELMITNTSVVDDPIRTTFTAGSSDARNGVWTFKHLMENMAPTPEAAPAMVEAMLNSMVNPTVINGSTVAGRPGVQDFILSSWPRTTDGALDLAQAPLRLQAIVNRFDLRNLTNGDAGEGRFVFAFESFGFPLQATLIFEYKLPAATDADVLGWANAFHGLGALSFGETYNAALQAITESFVGRDARPGHPNGSAINAVRTNEISFGDNGIWELREFRLSATTGQLDPVPVELTPRRELNFTGTLVSFINDNQAAIIADQHVVPLAFQGQPFQAGAIFNDLGAWFAAGTNAEARHHFSLNTCNGCHANAETGVVFLQIFPRFSGNEASLSGFLTGTTRSDPSTGQTRQFNDLRRRNLDLKAIVCTDPAAQATAGTSLRKGIDRVH
jgi:hypothetical protein